MAIARGYETADQNLKELKTHATEVNEKSEPVHKISSKKHPSTTSRSTTNSGVTCNRCGAAGHKATTCRFRDCVCHRCKKKGHLARVCRSSARTPQQGHRTRPTGSQPVRQVEEESDSDDYTHPVGLRSSGKIERGEYHLSRYKLNEVQNPLR